MLIVPIILFVVALVLFFVAWRQGRRKLRLIGFSVLGASFLSGILAAALSIGAGTHAMTSGVLF
jgi:glucose-6-phosphate-specific signal transduction histidine kinase